MRIGEIIMISIPLKRYYISGGKTNKKGVGKLLGKRPGKNTGIHWETQGKEGKHTMKDTILTIWLVLGALPVGLLESPQINKLGAQLLHPASQKQ